MPMALASPAWAIYAVARFSSRGYSGPMAWGEVGSQPQALPQPAPPGVPGACGEGGQRQACESWQGEKARLPRIAHDSAGAGSGRSV